MKKIFAFFIVLPICLAAKVFAVKFVPRVPRLDITQMVDIEECIRVYEEEKLDFINSLILQVWNEDFGKFTELFYKHHFKLPMNKKREFEAMTVTEDTVLVTELLMKYLYLSPTKSCLNFFRCWLEFYKNFRCTARKKEIIFGSFKEFVCRFLIEISRNFYITDELLRERTAIMCEIYDLEDKKTLSL